MRWACLAMLLGCLGPTTVEAGQDTSSSNRALLDLAGRAIAALQDRLGPDVRVLRLHFGPREATLEAQDPAEPSHVDRYTFREARPAESEPVAVGRNLKELKARLFPLREVRLELLQRGLAEAVQATETEDGRPTHVTIERDTYSSDYADGWTAPQVRVYVDGPRGGGFLQWNVDGKRRRVQRW